MRAKTIFILNAVITGGYAIAFLVAAGPLLAVYGIAPSQEGTYMARWFGVGLLANGLTTWLARDAAESDVGRAIARALAIAYGVGVVLAIWGTLFGPFNVLGWIAVGFNLLLGAGFGYLATMRRAIPESPHLRAPLPQLPLPSGRFANDSLRPRVLESFSRGSPPSGRPT